jgi:hypothetical protein
MDPPLDCETELAADHVDWQILRTRSIGPGGFGDDRVDIWYVALLSEIPV